MVGQLDHVKDKTISTFCNLILCQLNPLVDPDSLSIPGKQQALPLSSRGFTPIMARNIRIDIDVGLGLGVIVFDINGSCFETCRTSPGHLLLFTWFLLEVV
jgi:hypothetical protein